MSEISEIAQIIRLEFEGVELAMKVGSASLKSMQKVAKFLYGLLATQKTKGKTTLKEMMMKGGDMQVFQFEENDLKQVKKLCKKYGILYTMIPKTDKDSTTRELLFHSEAVPRVNLMLKKLNNPKNAIVKSMESFVEGMSEEQMKVYEDAINDQEKMKQEKENKKNKKPGSDPTAETEKKTDIPEDRQKELDKVQNRIRQVNQQNNHDVHDIFIPKRMIFSEDETQIRVRMPDTPTDEPKFIGIDKKNLTPGEEKAGYLSFLDKSAHYEIYDKKGQRLGTIRGDELFKNHFSRLGRTLSTERKEKRTKTRKRSKEKVR